MITARRDRPFARSSTITVGGRAVATWTPSWWRSGGSFTLQGEEFRVTSSLTGSTTQLLDGSGAVVASATRMGRKHWAVEAGTSRYDFRRASPFRRTQQLVVGDRVAGEVRAVGWGVGSAEADLPGLPLATQVFVVAAVIALWRRQAASAAG